MSLEDFPKIESEKGKTRKELLEDFVSSLKEYGVEGIEARIEGNNLRIKQECGDGIRGIGYDGKFWSRLDYGKDAKNNPVANEFQYNKNTLASLESEFPGVTFKEEKEGMVLVQLDSSHLSITMAKLLGDKEVQLRGIEGWGNVDPFKFNKESKKWECRLKWGTVKFKECKLMVRDVEEREGEKVTKPLNIKWNGNYGEGAEQRMIINLGEENKEE